MNINNIWKSIFVSILLEEANLCFKRKKRLSVRERQMMIPKKGPCGESQVRILKESLDQEDSEVVKFCNLINYKIIQTT